MSLTIKFRNLNHHTDIFCRLLVPSPNPQVWYTLVDACKRISVFHLLFNGFTVRFLLYVHSNCSIHHWRSWTCLLRLSLRYASTPSATATHATLTTNLLEHRYEPCALIPNDVHRWITFLGETTIDCPLAFMSFLIINWDCLNGDSKHYGLNQRNCLVKMMRKWRIRCHLFVCFI